MRHTSVSLSEAKVIGIANGSYVDKEREEIAGAGFSVASLEAALWCFQRTNSFEEAILTAANLGDDADTTAAITGQIAGAFYGLSAIPDPWLGRLHAREKIADLSCRLHERTNQ